MNPTDFEWFSAAIILALGQGHCFHSHVGQSSDHGVDAKLLNTFGLLVLVQSKRFGAETSVGSGLIRDFAGAIVAQRATYGYLVTSSRLTSDACQEVTWLAGKIRVDLSYRPLTDQTA